MTARLIASTTHSTSNAGSTPNETPARPPRSLTARASRARGAKIDPHGYDAGRKRHLLVDTQGLLLHAVVHASDIQDRDGSVLVMATLLGVFPFLIKLYAGGGYQGPQLQDALQGVFQQINVEIVKRSDTAKGLPFCPNAGLSREPSAGSTDAVDWPRTGNASTVRLSRSCDGHQSA